MVSDRPETAATSIYRLAPAVSARLVGLGLLVLTVATFAVTFAALGVGWSPDLIIVVAVVGLVLVFALASWLRYRAYVVRLDDVGYSVRLVRGAGVKDGRWRDVTEAVAAKPRDVPCLVLKRTDGTTTSIPVGLLDVDRDDFAREVGTRLSRARGA